MNESLSGTMARATYTQSTAVVSSSLTLWSYRALKDADAAPPRPGAGALKAPKALKLCDGKVATLARTRGTAEVRDEKLRKSRTMSTSASRQAAASTTENRRIFSADP